MKILLVTPAPPGSRKGNRVTALRWTRLLRQLGHRVVIREEYHGERCDLLIALHAQHSFTTIEAFGRAQPGCPIILALTGTDVYKAIKTEPRAQQALQMASRLVVLQPLAVEELPSHLRARARVIYQSCEAPPRLTRKQRIDHRKSSDVIKITGPGGLRFPRNLTTSLDFRCSNLSFRVKCGIRKS